MGLSSKTIGVSIETWRALRKLQSDLSAERKQVYLDDVIRELLRTYKEVQKIKELA